MIIDKLSQVTDLVLKPGSNIGDHYASVMFRALITYNNQNTNDLETSLIVKTMPFVEGVKKDLLEQGDTFKIEIKVYSEVVPMIEKILKEANDDTEIACKCLYSSIEPHQTLVFEDLAKRNFESPGDFQSLKGDLIKVAYEALDKLAKFHAISFKSNFENGQISEDFKSGVLSGYFLDYVPLFRDGFNNFLNMLKKTPEFESYVPKFEKLIENGVLRSAQKGFNAVTVNEPTSLLVLNHGDAHLKNTMMSKSSGGKIDVLLIDFQTCYWGPAVMDLMYFLYMSIDAETRATKRGEIIYTYHKIFTETLKKTGFTGELPKLTDLYKDFITYKDYGMGSQHFLYKISFNLNFFQN